MTYYKVLTFAVSAFFAGVGGSVYAHYMTAMIPTNFNFNYSAELLSEVIIGGTGSLTWLHHRCGILVQPAGADA